MPPGKSRPDARPSRKNLFRVWLIRSFLLLALLGLMGWVLVMDVMHVVGG